jgi:hypothetical protein
MVILLLCVKKCFGMVFICILRKKIDMRNKTPTFIGCKSCTNIVGLELDAPTKFNGHQEYIFVLSSHSFSTY